MADVYRLAARDNTMLYESCQGFHKAFYIPSTCRTRHAQKTKQQQKCGKIIPVKQT